MSADEKQLLETLSRLNVNLSKIDRGNYLQFMLTQAMAERSTPPNASFGMALLDSISIHWVQILQSNERRKYAELVFSQAPFFLVNTTDAGTDALTLATLVNNASNGPTDLVLNDTALYSSSPNPIRIETSGTVYVASFDVSADSGPVVAQGLVTWQEAIFANLDAIPGFMVEHRAKPGEVANLTPGTLLDSIVGKNPTVPYTREGIR